MPALAATARHGPRVPSKCYAGTQTANSVAASPFGDNTASSAGVTGASTSSNPLDVLSPTPLRAPVAAGALLATIAAAVAGCDRGPAPGPSNDAALGDTLAGLVVHAYDLSHPDAVARLMALYPTQDPVISAAAGRVTTTRAALQRSIDQFWTRVGQNMQQPRFLFGERHVTVLGPDAAVLTMTYSIPHRTPEGMPHMVGGAWTAVFARRDGRWVIVQEHLSDRPATDSTTAMPAMPGMPGMPGMDSTSAK